MFQFFVVHEIRDWIIVWMDHTTSICFPSLLPCRATNVVGVGRCWSVIDMIRESADNVAGDCGATELFTIRRQPPI